MSNCSELLKELKVTDTQITLDGFAKEHEKRKNYIDCDRAWETTINNIFECSLAGNHITIRMNIDKLNIEGVIKTTQMLLSDSRWNKNISIYYYPLEPVGKEKASYYTEQEYEKVMSILYQKLFDFGYYDDRPEALSCHKLSLPCYSATLGTVAIDYKGRIYQCQHLLCREDYVIGNVNEGIKITNKLLSWYDGSLSPECRDCSVLPLCQGGCITKRHLGQSCYLCHMMKYRISVQEKLKVMLLKKQFNLN